MLVEEEEGDGIGAVGMAGVLEVNVKYLLFLAFVNAVGNPGGGEAARGERGGAAPEKSFRRGWPGGCR